MRGWNLAFPSMILRIIGVYEHSRTMPNGLILLCSHTPIVIGNSSKHNCVQVQANVVVTAGSSICKVISLA